MTDAYAKNYVFSAACMTANQGIVGGHAYSVLGV